MEDVSTVLLGLLTQALQTCRSSQNCSSGAVHCSSIKLLSTVQAHIWTQKKQVYLVSSPSHVVLHKQSAPHISVHRLFKKGRRRHSMAS